VVGEPVFAPKIGAKDEDDGYVIVQLLNSNLMKT
jgi:carotenoid cleavage dioxygenase-like enzyme